MNELPVINQEGFAWDMPDVQRIAWLKGILSENKLWDILYRVTESGLNIIRWGASILKELKGRHERDAREWPPKEEQKRIFDLPFGRFFFKVADGKVDVEAAVRCMGNSRAMGKLESLTLDTQRRLGKGMEIVIYSQKGGSGRHPEGDGSFSYKKTIENLNREEADKVIMKRKGPHAEILEKRTSWNGKSIA